MPTAVDQTATIPRTRESSWDPEEQHTVTRKTCVLVKNRHPRVTFDAPKPDTRNSVQQRRRKHGQREILESRDIRQVPTKRRTEVQSQNRDLLIRDVCTCLAHRAPPTLRALPPFWPPTLRSPQRSGTFFGVEPFFWRGSLPEPFFGVSSRAKKNNGYTTKKRIPACQCPPPLATERTRCNLLWLATCR